LFDAEFMHTAKPEVYGFISSQGCCHGPSEKITWVPFQEKWDGITVFTNQFIGTQYVDHVQSPIKVAWLMEPPDVCPRSYIAAKQNIHKFDFVLTHSQEMLDFSPKCRKFLTGGQVWIQKKDWKIYEKTKLVSYICSNKTMTSGMRYRHELAEMCRLRGGVDMWGSQYKRFDDKLEPLQDYMFTVTVHNQKMNHWFTEGLNDNFITGTVPIFWGCPNIDEYYDVEGMLIFETAEELTSILNRLTPELYHSKMDAIKRNFEIAHQYHRNEDSLAGFMMSLLGYTS
jgi:hypothetical protein